jgi:tetratricopeptide (TPR) repeat protein
VSTRFSVMVFSILAVSCACIAGPVTSSAHEGLDHDIERETRSLAEDPSNVEARLRRARYYRLDEQLEKALADLQQATRLAPDDARVHFEKGFALAALGRNTDAEAELSVFIAQTGGTPDAHAERARIRALTGRPDLAIADLEVAIALGSSIDLYLERGRLLEGRARYAEAADGYREGLAQLGGSPLLQRVLVDALIVLGRYDDALAEIDAALARGQLETQWLLVRAEVLERLERTEEAREARLRALTKANESLGKRPTSANLVTRAVVHLALGDAPAARRDLEQALRNSPQMESAKAMLAAIAAEAGHQPPTPSIHP